MEAKFGGKAHHPHLYGPMVSDLNAVGKKSSLDWDLNDWKWDGDLLTATPLNSIAPERGARRRQCGVGDSSNSSSSFSDELERDVEKRRRGCSGDDDEFLRLGAGGVAYPIAEGEAKGGKKSKVLAAAGPAGLSPNSNSNNSNSGSSRAVCQVEDCRADLSGAKDYHKRHKVCDVHSKATKALVGTIMQRFCQQCSRFHVLQEFDEGKRSCRRRLAGHNRRRRKTHPDTVVHGGSLNDEKGSSYLLISLLRILSNMHTTSADQSKDQDLLSHLLKNLASVAGSVDGRNISSLLQGSQGSFNAGASAETSQKPVLMIAGGSETQRLLCSAAKMDDPTISQAPSNSGEQCPTVSVLNMTQTVTSSGDTNCGALQNLMGRGSTNRLSLIDSLKSKPAVEESRVGRIKYNNIDLNSIYDDSQDLENPGSSYYPRTSETLSHDNPLFVHKSSPTQLSQHSDSTTTQSPSTSSGEAQSRTDRIVFKLFGKDPSDLPADLRSQIFNWLSNTPTDIESYIRPGCIILTIYLHLEKYTWEELCSDLGSSLKKLLNASNDPFWSTGWVYCRVRNYVAFAYNGHLILETPLPLNKNCRISSIKPVAVSLCENTQFVVKGSNLNGPSTRLLCALDGKYLVQETCRGLMNNNDATVEHEEIQSLRFSCSVPSVTGRGFIEVEDHGLSSTFFPFIVAEKEVCSEICTLESAIEVSETGNNVEKQPNILEAKNQAVDFIHEMGWLLNRSRVKCRLGPMDPHSALFPLRRYKWLVQFSLERDWCSVVNKLLSILFEGCVDSGAFSSVEVAVSDMGLLHRAVRRNCRPMVELLLKFAPHKAPTESGSGSNEKGVQEFLFKPDIAGPNGLTPLHIAACQVGFESVLDALTDDPGKVGIEAWRNAKDETGLTPNDYASLGGHYSYINLVQRKSGQVVVDIPAGPAAGGQQRTAASKFASLELDRFAAVRRQCGACQQLHRRRHHHKMMTGGHGHRSSLVYRPAMLSMLAIAAVCVCVALLFKSSPEVLYVFQPFRWERLKYGSS